MMPLAVPSQKYSIDHLIIEESTNEGIVLIDYFRKKRGRLPRGTEVHFEVNPGVIIVGKDINTPALEPGSDWPSSIKIKLINKGSILGRGGRGADPDLVWSYDVPQMTIIQGRAAEAGGTAVKGDLLIENHGLIAGGGGGGGGKGIYVGGNAYTLMQVHSASGGGAPYGSVSPAAATIEWWLEKFENTPYYNVLKEIVAYGRMLASQRIGGAEDILFKVIISETGVCTFYHHYGRPRSDPELGMKIFPEIAGASKHVIKSSKLWNLGIWFEVPKRLIDTPAAKDTAQINTSILSMKSDKTYITNSHHFNGRSIIYRGLFERASTGELLIGGRGGAGLNGIVFTAYNTHEFLLNYMISHPSYIDTLRAPKGGNVGEDGEDGSYPTHCYTYLYKWSGGHREYYEYLPIASIGINEKQRIPPTLGGRAGFIKEGNVTIINVGNGTAKGR